MNEKYVEILKEKLEIKLSESAKNNLKMYEPAFLKQNAKLNLMSKNDEKFLFEKHIFDSLAINKFFKKFDKLDIKKVLDIGTGGGFPSLPMAICFEHIEIHAVDSIGKKINALEEIKKDLALKNLSLYCDRAENFAKTSPKKFDCVTVRAVSTLETILHYAIPNLRAGGHLIAYKSKKIEEEIKNAQKTLKNHRSKIVDIIEYELPLEDMYNRNLVIIEKSL